MLFNFRLIQNGAVIDTRTLELEGPNAREIAVREQYALGDACRQCMDGEVVRWVEMQQEA